jgi:hypothetical protein
MKKKPTKRRTAKRAKPKRIPRDPATGQPLLFDPATGKATTGHRPMTASEWREYDRLWEVRHKAVVEREAARLAERQARLALRPAAMRDQDYQLPQDVAAFLEALDAAETEAKIMRGIGQHANIVALLDTAFVTGRNGAKDVFLLLEYVQQLASPTARVMLLSDTAPSRCRR